MDIASVSCCSSLISFALFRQFRRRKVCARFSKFLCKCVCVGDISLYQIVKYRHIVTTATLSHVRTDCQCSEFAIQIVIAR